jgi:hypothetical protein
MSLIIKGLAVAALVAAAGCQVKKTQEGELPDVKVQGGQLPKYEIKPEEGSRVHVRMDTTTIVVPKLEVGPDTAKH